MRSYLLIQVCVCLCDPLLSLASWCVFCVCSALSVWVRTCFLISSFCIWSLLLAHAHCPPERIDCLSLSLSLFSVAVLISRSLSFHFYILTFTPSLSWSSHQLSLSLSFILSVPCAFLLPHVHTSAYLSNHAHFLRFLSHVFLYRSPPPHTQFSPTLTNSLPWRKVSTNLDGFHFSLSLFSVFRSLFLLPYLSLSL